MAHALLTTIGGTVVLPADGFALVDRDDGGCLIVNPPREVWERSELSVDELCAWSCLVAATSAAMLACVPQLRDGCINYWEAGNWALNALAPPEGAKSPTVHRKVHLHLLGRSPRALSPAWAWGEAPAFPRYADRTRWASGNRRLLPGEVRQIVLETIERLTMKYRFTSDDLTAFAECRSCSYPFAPIDGARYDTCQGCSQ